MKDELMPIIRIGLYAVAGRLSAGGWLPADAAAMIPSPEIVEIVAGVIMGVATFTWYWASKARAALIKLARGGA